MTYDYELTLIKNTYTTNAMGDSVATQTKTVVYAGLITYRSREFRQAQANGLRPEKTFAINEFEYDGEKEVEFDKTLLSVIDTYPINAKDESEFEKLALICSGIVNVNGAG